MITRNRKNTLADSQLPQMCASSTGRCNTI